MPHSHKHRFVSTLHRTVRRLCREQGGKMVTPIFQGQLDGRGVCRAVVTHWLASFMDSLALDDRAHLEVCRYKLRHIRRYISQFRAIHGDFHFHLQTPSLDAVCIYRKKVEILKRTWKLARLGDSIPFLHNGYYYISIGSKHGMGMKLCDDGVWFIDANSCEFHFPSIGKFSIFFKRYVTALYPSWGQVPTQLFAMDVQGKVSD